MNVAIRPGTPDVREEAQFPLGTTGALSIVPLPRGSYGTVGHPGTDPNPGVA
jgi:hypothetical protein